MTHLKLHFILKVVGPDVTKTLARALAAIFARK